MTASPLDVLWDRFRKPASEETDGTKGLQTPPTTRTLACTMPDPSIVLKVARVRHGEPAAELKETNVSHAPPAVAMIDAVATRRWDKEFDVLFKAAHERNAATADPLVPPSPGPAQKCKHDQDADIGTKREDQTRFRLAWAETRLENCAKRKEKSESFSLVDAIIGVYHGLDPSRVAEKIRPL